MTEIEDDAASVASLGTFSEISEVNSEFKYGAKAKSVLDIWPLGGVECLNRAPPRWSDEPKIHVESEPVRIEGISERLAGYSHSCFNDTFLETVGLRNPVSKLFKDTAEGRARQKKIDKAHRDVKRTEMNDLRSDAHTLLVFETSLYPEEGKGNARLRMMSTVIKQCMKMTDLFEEAAQCLDILDEKDEDISKWNEKLSDREAKRTGLEKDTAELRKEIYDLQQALQASKDSTQAKVSKDIELNAELKNQKDAGMRMVKTAEVAKGKISTLRNAMATAEKSMEASINDIKTDDV